MGTVALLVVVALGVGGAGWYFKIYKPKQNTADESELEDFDYAEADSYDEYEDTQPETSWDEDEAEPYEEYDNKELAYDVDEMIHEVQEPEPAPQDDEPTYDVDEIIREVRESEPKPEAPPVEKSSHDEDGTYDWARDLVDEIIRKVRESEGRKT